jgi:glycosyltransferase involved in cell wall biosynthesis
LFYPDIPRDYFFEISARQFERGHHVDVLTWRKNRKDSEETTTEDIEIHRLNGLNFNLDGIIQTYPYLPGLPALVEKLKPDIVHGESHLFLPTFQAIRKAKNLGLPSVVSVHGVFADRGFTINLAQKCYIHTIGSEIFKNATRIICLTHSDGNEILRYRCPPEKIRVVPNAVDTDLFNPGQHREEDLIVWVGRFVPEKGMEYVIEAARLITEHRANVKFLLIGYGYLKTNVMKVAQNYGLLGKSVYFLGPISREEISKILRKATVFIFPSLKEGLPIAVLEAMASGLPVVGSDIPSLRTIITNKENGILVPPRNYVEFANAIILLLEDADLRRKLGQNARHLILEKYTWNIISEEIEKVYKEAIEEAGC